MFTVEGRLFLKRPDTANLGVWETRSENTRKKTVIQVIGHYIVEDESEGYR